MPLLRAGRSPAEVNRLRSSHFLTHISLGLTPWDISPPATWSMQLKAPLPSNCTPLLQASGSLFLNWGASWKSSPKATPSPF